MGLSILVVIAMAIAAGFWFSYYQSVKKLRAHDRETVRLMEETLQRMQTTGSSPNDIAAMQRKIAEFRTKNRVK